MKYIDYHFDITEDRIILDEEINIDKLGWKHGDLFTVKNVNGRVMLVKIDPLVAFVKGYKLPAGE